MPAKERIATRHTMCLIPNRYLKPQMKTLKQKFRGNILTITLALIFTGAVTGYFVSKSFNRYQLLSTLDQLAQNELEISVLEKEFVIFESINPDFFKTNTSTIKSKADDLLSQSLKSISEIRKEGVSKKSNIAQLIDASEQYLITYKTELDSLQTLFLDLGYQEYGLSGQMRSRIHKVEQAIKNNREHSYLNVLMLTLRRHEKDYMLRKDPEYLKRFSATMESMKKEVILQTGNLELIEWLNAYETSFKDYVAKDIQIGSRQGKGKLSDLHQTMEAIKTCSNGLKNQISYEARKEIRKAMIYMSILIILCGAFIIFILSRLSNRIISSVNHLRHYISRLGRGELPKSITNTNNDEIGEMIDSINNLTKNLVNTKEFALEIAKGNLDTEVFVFNNTGDLGTSLINMRNQLALVSKEREKQKLEEDIRNWTNEGMARFSEILRNKEEKLKDYCYEAICFLVKYTTFNQGGMYLKTEVQGEFMLELQAAYAFNRRKYHQQLIPWKEGLTGVVCMEQESVYLTDIPNDYIQITSGLGGANPKSLFIVPIRTQNNLYGVMEFASFQNMEPHQRLFIEKTACDLASALETKMGAAQTSKLLIESEELAEQLKMQEETLRQTLEEMQATQEESAKTINELKIKVKGFESAFPVFELNALGMITAVSHGMEHFSHKKASQFVGRKFSDFISDYTVSSSLWGKLNEGYPSKEAHRFSFRQPDQLFLCWFIPIQTEGGMLQKVYLIVLNSYDSQAHEITTIKLTSEKNHTNVLGSIKVN